MPPGKRAEQAAAVTAGASAARPIASAPRSGVTINVTGGEMNMGDKFNTNVSNATVGSIAVGGGDVSAEGHVAITTTTQADYIEQLKAAQSALVKDQDTLDRIDANLFEGVSKMLRLARQIEVEQARTTAGLAALKESVDEVWAKSMGEDLRKIELPNGLEVVKTLLANPITAELAKKLLESASG